MDYYGVLRQCELEHFRREPLRRRETFVIDFDRCRTTQPAVRELAHLPAIRGTLWIDADDRVVVRWQASLARGPNAGIIVYETDSERMPDGIWTGTTTHLNLAADPALFGNQRIEFTYQLRNRRRFGVTTDQSIAEPK